MWLFKKKPRKIRHIKVIGETTHCVNCGKKIDEGNYVGTGHVMKQNETILANFCNQLCIRDMGYKDRFWNGTYWIQDYGLKLRDEPLEYEA